MHAIGSASVIMSVESVVESIVSMYENRQSKFRNLGEDRENNDMMRPIIEISQFPVSYLLTPRAVQKK